MSFYIFSFSPRNRNKLFTGLILLKCWTYFFFFFAAISVKSVVDNLIPHTFKCILLWSPYGPNPLPVHAFVSAYSNRKEFTFSRELDSGAWQLPHWTRTEPNCVSKPAICRFYGLTASLRSFYGGYGEILSTTKQQFGITKSQTSC